MSWFSEIAGKAETLLNKIDQNAATALLTEKPAASINARGDDLTEVTTDGAKQDNFSYGAYPFGPPKQPSSSPQKMAPIAPVVPRSPKTSRIKEPDEEKLIEFLNSSDGANGTHRREGSSCNSSIQNEILNESSWDSGSIRSFSSSRRPSTASLTSEAVSNGMTNEQKPSEVSTPASSPPTDAPDSTSENQMLRQEIASLNQEMSQVLNRAKNAEQELSEYRSRSVKDLKDRHDREKRLQELEDRINEEQMQKERRETELAKDIERLRQTAETEGAHHRRLRDEVESVRTNHEQQTTALLQEMEAKEREIERVRVQLRVETTSLSEAVKSLELDRSRRSVEVEALRSAVDEKSTQILGLESSIQSLRKELADLNRQYGEYKSKAKKILQEKEKLIEALKSEEGYNGTGEKGDDVELRQMCCERDLLRDEAQQLSDQLVAVRQETSQRERHLLQQIEALTHAQADTSAALQEQIKRREELEQEISSANLELRFLQEDLTRQKASFQAKLNEKDSRIADLTDHIATVSNSKPVSPHANEDRVRQLTEALLQKQSLLEAVTAEKTSLVLKIERLEKSHCDTTPFHRSTNKPSDEKAPPSFLQESPFDTGVTRKVKRAYGSIDKLSVRIGTTFRRYPMVRIFVIAYMLLLHSWVFLILFNSTPDGHLKR